jgi:hypothetical protein
MVGNKVTTFVDPDGRLEVWIGDKKYDYDFETDKVKVLNKNGKWQSIRTDGPKAISVFREADKIRESLEKLNTEQIAELYSTALECELKNADAAVKKQFQDRLDRIREMEKNFPIGTKAWSRLEKLGFAVSLYAVGEQVYVTVQDPSLINLAILGGKTGEFALNIAAALGAKLAERILFPIAVVGALKDVYNIGVFTCEVAGLANDTGKMLQTQLRTATKAQLQSQQLWYSNIEAALDSLQQNNEIPTAGSLRNRYGR